MTDKGVRLMRKKGILTLAALSFLVLSACTGEKTFTAGSTSLEASERGTVGGEYGGSGQTGQPDGQGSQSSQSGQDGRQPDEGQTAQRTGGPDGNGQNAQSAQGGAGQVKTLSSGSVTMGVVSKVVGNEVTINLIEPIEVNINRGAKKSSSSSSSSSGSTSGRGNQGGSAQGGNVSIFGSTMGGGMPSMRMWAGGAESGSGSSSSENKISVDYKGGQKTFYVPVGLRISANTGTAITFDSLEKGNVLSVGYDETGERIIMMSVLGSV